MSLIRNDSPSQVLTRQLLAICDFAGDDGAGGGGGSSSDAVGALLAERRARLDALVAQQHAHAGHAADDPPGRGAPLESSAACLARAALGFAAAVDAARVAPLLRAQPPFETTHGLDSAVAGAAAAMARWNEVRVVCACADLNAVALRRPSMRLRWSTGACAKSRPSARRTTRGGCTSECVRCSGRWR
ncbi:hypothetical protein HDU84_008712 [Entophlyctis sp. JEL0112]|nr:hypothetical protein HDU84_008712 [Entophlyctis sp. JEL0112]